jgi:Arc/MetJ-type ribon-helix-helix transcriptional regulator
MAIQLTKAVEAEIDAALRAGSYRSANEVVGQGFALIKVREQLRKSIADGAAQLDRGDVVTRSEMLATFRKRRRTRSKER